MIERQLMRMGVRYERASQARDYGLLIQLERELRDIESDTDFWITPFVVRGRNIIRRRLGLERIEV
jgi:hypothetical protein